MKTSPQYMPTINLPSLVRKVMKAYALKSLIRDSGSQLQRIGRSRNWQLKATFEQLEQVILAIQNSEEISWQWLAIHLAKQREHLSHDELIRIAKLKPEITVNQLMARTDCTIAQARKIIDELEWL
jgi:hypothetical protein